MRHSSRPEPGANVMQRVAETKKTSKLAVAFSGGGARAAYQAGVLCHIGRRLPNLQVPILTGVSAGGINLGFLASYRGTFLDATKVLRNHWLSLSTEKVFQTRPTSLLKGVLRSGASLLAGGSTLGPDFRSLLDTSPLRQFVKQSTVMSTIQERLDAGEIKAVGLTAISYKTGRTVLFVQGDTPIGTMPSRSHHRIVQTSLTIDHIMASASIPILFPAVKIGQEYYGDGSFRLTAPLGPAIHLGAERIFAISARYSRTTSEAKQPESIGYPPPARVLGLLLNSAFLDTLDSDATSVRRINHLIDQLGPDARERESLRQVDLLIQRPSQDIGNLASDFEVQLPRVLRFLVRGLGTPNTRNADFLSYLLFESEYIRTLIELGEEDAESNWEQIRNFLT
jgi:NTE family protein